MANALLVNGLKAVGFCVTVYSWLIVADALLSWFIDPANKIRIFLNRLASPIVEPFRRLTARFSGGMPIDLSPLLAILALNLVRTLIDVLVRRLQWY